MIRFIVLCISALIMYGCTSILSFQDKIQLGMSKNEIQNMLGKPKFKRMNTEYEEWEYREIVPDRGDNVLTVTFVNGKVVSMNTYSDYYTPETIKKGIVPVAPPVIVVPTQNRPYYKPMGEKDFNKLYFDVKEENFYNDRKKIIEHSIKNNSITCAQCARIISLYDFENEKLNILEVMNRHISDIQNMDVILEKFTFISTKNQAKKLMSE